MKNRRFSVQYLALATFASVCTTALAVPVPLDLSTKLHDLSAGSGGQVLQIDVNNDGANDLGFNSFTVAPGVALASVELIGSGQALSDTPDNDWPNLDLTYPPVGPSDVILEVPAGQGVVEYVEAHIPDTALSGGQKYAAELLDPIRSGDPLLPVFDRAVVANREFYIGFRVQFPPDTAMHYGWVKARLDWDTSSDTMVGTWTVIAAAYESLADTDINAGDSGTPTCRPDFNQSGAVSVQDIFDFLAAWFAGGTNADFNLSGTVSVQDIFDFLAAWFAGC